MDIDNKTIKKIAKFASSSELGVRSIKQVLKQIFKEALFVAPNQRGITHKIAYD